MAGPKRGETGGARPIRSAKGAKCKSLGQRPRSQAMLIQWSAEGAQ